MARKFLFTSITLKTLLHLFLLTATTRYANAARHLTEEKTPAVVPAEAPEPEDNHPEPVKGTAATQAAPAAAAATTGANAAAKVDSPAISFFMHDILGGSAPSERVVAGITANTATNNLPFAKTNGGVFPQKGGIPLVTANNGKINNNLPSLTGINGATASTVINTNGNNNVIAGKNQPFVSVGQLPAAATLQELLFGSIMVIDNEITEGHELGSSVIGKAQGFHLACSLDGSSRTMAFTAIFHNGDKEEDTISFFGVHRTASHESLLAIVGGTGKYEDARGQAKIENVNLPDQHITDGAETLAQISVYLH